jgi:hypothetical protein
MRPIEVFYHVFIPADIRYTQWNWWIDQQLQLIQQSKLSDIAKINMAITMPSHYGEVSPGTRIPFRVNGSKDVSIVFEQKVREYIGTRYPFVDIINIRDTGEPNIFEGHTLKLLWDRCQLEDIDVLYLHSKGVVSASPQVACWREILNYYCITEWPKCVSSLSLCDVTGVQDLNSIEHNTISGNFWWSKSAYIKKLPDPLHGDINNRYSFEQWIMKATPQIIYQIDTKIDHHDDYCFLENIVNT